MIFCYAASDLFEPVVSIESIDSKQFEQFEPSLQVPEVSGARRALPCHSSDVSAQKFRANAAVGHE